MKQYIIRYLTNLELFNILYCTNQFEACISFYASVNSIIYMLTSIYLLFHSSKIILFFVVIPKQGKGLEAKISPSKDKGSSDI